MVVDEAATTEIDALAVPDALAVTKEVAGWVAAGRAAAKVAAAEEEATAAAATEAEMVAVAARGVATRVAEIGRAHV